MQGSPSAILAEDLGTAMEFSTGEELMYHLRSGMLDCVIMESTVAAELVSATSGVRILNEPLLEYDMRFAVAKENVQLLQAVNSALETLRENGTLRGLLNSYFAGRSFTYVPPDDVAARPGYLSVAISPDSPPYSFIDENGELAGLDIDVARAVCDILGVELRLIEMEARDLVTAVWFGRADLALGWLPVDGEELIAISDAYASSAHVVIVRR
jgi:polar amino acid transport system substrate-binding protein